MDVLGEFVGIPKFSVPSTADGTRTHLRIVGRTALVHGYTHTGSRIAEWLKRRRPNRVVAGLRDSMVGELLLASGMRFEHVSPDISQAVYRLIADEIDRLHQLLGRTCSPCWLSDRGSSTVYNPRLFARTDAFHEFNRFSKSRIKETALCNVTRVSLMIWNGTVTCAA